MLTTSFEALFEAVLNGWWQGILLTLLVWLVLRDLRRIGAATRLAIWQLTLVIVLLLPALQRIPLRSLKPPALAPALRTAPIRPQPARARISASEISAPVRPSPLIELPRHDGPKLFVSVAVLLGLIQLLRLALSYCAVRRLKRNGKQANVALPVTQSRRVDVLVSERISMPMAVGYLRPAVLLPRAVVKSLTPEQMRYVLLHESAHLDRKDDWAALAERFIRAVFCFQPAVHWIGRQIEREREMACDDWVAERSGEAKTYASALVRLAELRLPGRVPILAAGAGRRKEIFARLERLLDRTRNRIPAVSGPLVAVASVLLLLAVFQGAQFNHLFGLSRFSDNWVETDGARRKAMHMRGDIEFSPDDRDVESMSPGAMLVIEQSDGWRSRRVEFEADERGSIQRRYFSGGTAHPFDSEARRFLAGMLPQWVREQGHNIPEHVARSIRENGVDGALEDIRTLRGNAVKRQYLEEVFVQADLSLMQQRRVLKIAGEMESATEKRQFLENVQDRYTDHALDGHLFDYIDSLHSDDDRRHLLTEIIERGDPPLPRLSRSVGLMPSDDAKSAVLTEAARVPNRQLPTAFFDAVSTIHSDDDREHLLSMVLTVHGGDPGTVAQALRSAAAMNSDEDKAKVVLASANSFRGESETLPEAARVLASIHSDGERRRALEALIQADGKNADTLRELLLQTSTLNSDEDKSHVLLQVAGEFSEQEPVRHAFFLATNTIHSSADQRRVLMAVLARPGLEADTLREVSSSAFQIASSEDQVAVLKRVAERR